jgi:c-di-GMP-related signal transduction protein
MKNVYVARQPIFDANKRIYAYELLFRDGAGNCIPEIDGDVATKALLTNSFFSFGMDTLVGGRRFFINFTQNLLEKKVPLLLPKERVVVEILEDVMPTPAVIAACAEMAAKGYTIALDDFVYSTELEPLIALADIIKFDFRLTPEKAIDACLKQLPEANRTLLAEKVESYNEFEAALEMGFELFQGYFFCRPEVIQRAEIQGSQLHLMAIMAQLANESFQLEEMEKLISRDISISYKLFKYLNSAFFGRACKVSSVREALVYLGEKEFRRFIALIAMSRLAEGKPNELIRAACIRGKFCELLGAELKINASPSEMFTLGMFSLIDAVIDRPMKRIMAELPLSGAIKTALVDARGPLIGVIELVRRYESGQWDKVSRLSRALQIGDETLPALYLQACQWSEVAAKASV